jgi:hypothetical protein
MANEETNQEEVTTAVPEAAPQTAPAEESTDLTINDLNGLKSVIDVATQRGAFKAGELEAVGKIYNRLDKFLAAATKGQ